MYLLVSTFRSIRWSSWISNRPHVALRALYTNVKYRASAKYLRTVALTYRLAFDYVIRSRIDTTLGYKFLHTHVSEYLLRFQPILNVHLSFAHYLLSQLNSFPMSSCPHHKTHRSEVDTYSPSGASTPRKGSRSELAYSESACCPLRRCL